VHVWEAGDGPLPVVCIHETGTTSEVWRPLAAQLASRARVVAYDRRAWGESEAPAEYARTTVAEQSGDAAALIHDANLAQAIVCGAGIGAVAALALSLHSPELVLGTVLIEPPLLAFATEATEALSADGRLLRDTIAEQGRDAVADVYAAGAFEALGAGAGRLPAELRDTGPHATRALFAEIAAVPAWELPLAEMATTQVPAVIVTGAGTPALLRIAADGLAAALARSRRAEAGTGLPHLDDPAAIAREIAALAESV
jgi:3-oxoadipate enol-lactonase